jgi:uncharacterized membrane protein
MKSRTLRIFLALLLLLWCTGFALPILVNEGFAAVSGLVLSGLYSPVCHQAAEKSFSAGGLNFLVCARCTGIYTGALIISIIVLFVRPVKVKYLIPAALLMGADVLSVNAGLYNYSKIIAFSTGLLLGLSLFPYILSALEKSLSVNEIK